MTQISPTPWTIEDHPHVTDSDGCYVATVLDAFINDVNVREGNAHLIAAAPELLEALKAVYADWQAIADAEQFRDKNIDAIARAAISKAEGK